MDKFRIRKLQKNLNNPILVKKKENLLYLTGRSFMHGYLLVKPAKYPHLASPYLKGRNKKASPLKIRGDTGVIFLGDGLERIEGINSNILQNIGMYLPKRGQLMLEEEFSFAEFNYIQRKVKSAKRKIKIRHGKSPVDYQRIIKDEGEIRLIGKSMQIVGKVFEQVRRKLMNTRQKRIYTEIKLAEFIKQAGLKLGAEDVSFPPIVASGANTAIPHHVPSNKKLRAGESIIIDFGFKYKNYCSDFTRTVFLKRAPSRLEKVYNQVEKAYNESMKFISSVIPEATSGARAVRNLDSRFRGNDKKVNARKSMVIGNDVYQKAVNVLAEKKLDKYFIHSLGHGTGLEIHELPNLSPGSKDALKEGMVFSIEPGVYIPKLGGIRIEDLVYLPRGDSKNIRGLKKREVKKFINVSTELQKNILL